MISSEPIRVVMGAAPRLYAIQGSVQPLHMSYNFPLGHTEPLSASRPASPAHVSLHACMLRDSHRGGALSRSSPSPPLPPLLDAPHGAEEQAKDYAASEPRERQERPRLPVTEPSVDDHACCSSPAVCAAYRRVTGPNRPIHHTQILPPLLPLRQSTPLLVGRIPTLGGRHLPHR